jgi:hypothetical protein
MTADIIARLEKATGPDRELDARIHVAMFPDQEIMTDGGSVGGPGGIRPAAYSTIGLQWPDGDGLEIDPRGLADLIQAPAYTASLDAALARVGEKLPGWIVRLDIYNSRTSAGVESHDTEPMSFSEGEGPTSPLAVLLALFRALETA